MQCKLTSKEIKLGVLLLQPTNRRHPYIVCKCRHIHGSCTEKTNKNKQTNKRVPCFVQKFLFVLTLSRKGVFIPYYLEAPSLRHICCTEPASKLCQRSCPQSSPPRIRFSTSEVKKKKKIRISAVSFKIASRCHTVHLQCSVRWSASIQQEEQADEDSFHFLWVCIQLLCILRFLIKGRLTRALMD